MTEIFDNQINLYSLSKTLRFELIPEPETKETLKTEKLIEKDIELDANYQKSKIIFNQLHSDFIEESLNYAAVHPIDWSKYFTIYQQIKNQTDKDEVKKLKQEKEKVEKEIRKLIINLFGHTASQWKNKYKLIDKKGKSIFKKDSYQMLTEKAVLELIREKYKSNSNIDLLNNFDSFFTYFSGFNQNRENYYSDDDKATAVSYRIVNENLPKFCQNILDYRNKISQFVKINNENIFEINNFSNYLSQAGINQYNKEIGGERDEKQINAQKIQGINEKINLYCQQTKQKIPRLKFLYKQIGVIQNKKELFFTIDGQNHTLKNTLEICLDQSKIYNQKILDLVDKISDPSKFDQIYLSKAAINTIQRKYFSNWFEVQESFINQKIFSRDKKDSSKITVPEYVSLLEFRLAFDNCSIKDKKHIFKDEYSNLSSDTDLFNVFISIIKNEFAENIKSQNDLESGFLGVISQVGDRPTTEQKEIIKKYLDTSLVVLQMARYFKIKESSRDINNWDSEFYNELESIFQNYPLYKWYDAVRNYLTKKPYTEDKIKVNFDKGNLLGGWPDSPPGNTQYGAYIFKKNNEYYLGVTRDSRLFDVIKHPDSRNQDGNFQKMDLRQLDGKTIFGSLYSGRYGKKYADDKKTLSNLELIKNVKSILLDKSDIFPSLKNIISTDYNDPTKLAADISSSFLYSLDFEKVSETYTNKSQALKKENPLYLFKISNKDFDNTTKYHKNLHTLYFLNTLKNDGSESKFKLCGGGEIFFRKASIPEVTDEKRSHGINIIKNKRYTNDKYFFHVPIILNADQKNYYPKFNQKINECLSNSSSKVHVIGIDRGEKHLAYYSVIDTNGNIVEQGSLNQDLLGKDYAKKLEEKAQERGEARENWDEIGQIKNLKEGYVSQVVKRISDLVIKYNGVVVLEDLNIGFKRGRQKIEKSVYQKLELALAKKFNYLVDKNASEGEVLSSSKALQLTPPVNNFGDIMGKQWGIMFYINASYTSVTDPITGFRKQIYLKPASRDSMISSIKKFDEIIYDPSYQGFKFTFFTKKFDEKLKNKKWECFTCVDRIYNRHDKDINKWISTKINITGDLTKLFNNYHVDINQNIVNQIVDNPNLDNNFFESLIFYINLLFQLRNSDTSQNIDFINSPIEPFFDSRKVADDKMPTNGDANGAYNIARKGLIVLNKIKKDPSTKDIFVSNDDWDYVSQNWPKYTSHG